MQNTFLNPIPNTLERRDKKQLSLWFPFELDALFLGCTLKQMSHWFPSHKEIILFMSCDRCFFRWTALTSNRVFTSWNNFSQTDFKIPISKPKPAPLYFLGKGQVEMLSFPKCEKCHCHLEFLSHSALIMMEHNRCLIKEHLFIYLFILFHLIISPERVSPIHISVSFQSLLFCNRGQISVLTTFLNYFCRVCSVCNPWKKKKKL